MENDHTGKYVLGTIIGIVAAFLFFSTFGTVPAGYRGVLLQFGAPTGAIKQPGLYMKIPLVQGVELVNTQIQAFHSQQEDAASSDLQDVHTVLTVNWQIDPQDVVYVVSVLGNDVESRVLTPNIQESIRSSEARYTAEQLITQRPLVKALADNTLLERVSPYHIRIIATAFTSFTFSETFTQAIEAKVTAEQAALQAKNVLLQKQYEAQQAIATAEGASRALQLRRAQLNPLIIQDEWIQKWHGDVPTYYGGGGNNILLSLPSATNTTTSPANK